MSERGPARGARAALGPAGAPGGPPSPEEIRRRLARAWAEGLGRAFESLAGVRPQLHWQPGENPPAADGEDETLWWEQPFPVGPGASAWVGAPRSTWEYAGARTLKAAGVESAEAQEVKDTWFEILGQSFPAVAREAGLLWRREVVLEPGRKDLPAAASGARMSAGLEFPGEPPRGLSLVFGEALLAALSTPQENSPEEQEAQPGSEPEPAGPSGLPGAPSPTLDLLLGIELPVSISFGKKRLPLRDVLKLTTGSIVELDRDVDEPVEILVNQCLIARGEVVVVQGNYGVRIQEIASRAERLRSLP